MHYPGTVAISDAVGKAIARYVNRTPCSRYHDVSLDTIGTLEKHSLLAALWQQPFSCSC